MRRIPLLTKYDLLRHIDPAWVSVSTVMKRLHEEEVDEFTLKGHFVLLISGFEAMLSELATTYLMEHPDRLSDAEPKIAMSVFLEQATTSYAIEMLIEKKMLELNFGAMSKLLTKTLETLTLPQFQDQSALDRLTEFKETRNLLLHNNLVVNSRYLEKAGPCGRGTRRGRLLGINTPYVLAAAEDIACVIAHIEGGIRHRFREATRLAKMRALWEYTLETPIARPFEDFWHVDEANDRIKGWKPNPHSESFSHSEQMYYQLWVQHCAANVDIKNFHMKRLSDDQKMYWFLEQLYKLSLENGLGDPIVQ